MFPSQSNTQPAGPRVYNSGESLVGMEARLVKVVDGGSISELLLPTAVSDICVFVLGDGGAIDTNSTVLPLVPGEEIRVLANGAGSAGDIVVLEAIAGANIGKVRTLPAAAGVYFSPGSAAEDFVDEQLVKINPLPRMVTVATQVTLTSTNGTAASQAPAALTSTDGTAAAAAANLAGLAAEAEKIGDDVRALHAKYTLLVAEVEKIGDDVRATHAALVVNGQVTA